MINFFKSDQLLNSSLNIPSNPTQRDLGYHKNIGVKPKIGDLGRPHDQVSQPFDYHQRCLAAMKGGGEAMLNTIRGYQKGKFVGHRTTLKSATTYLAIAAFWGYMDGKIDPLVLASAFTVGAFISPALAPWIKIFPVTGDPRYKGWDRISDLLINLLFHILSTSFLVWMIKIAVMTGAVFFSGYFEFPSFIKGSVGLVCANYLRKFSTEAFGARFLVHQHSFGVELMKERLERPFESVAHVRLEAWNELRDLPGPGLFGLMLRGWGKKKNGYRSLVEQSKVVDPWLGGLLDNCLRKIAFLVE